jgi:hypothetical protein
MTSSVIPEESIRRTISLGIKSTAFSPSSIPSRSLTSIDSTFFQIKSTTCKSNDHFVHQPDIDTDSHINNTLNPLDSSANTNAVNDQDESKILHPISECNVNNRFLFEYILFDFILGA